MTSGTPESTQNCVLPGFQNSLDLASMSPLEAKAMSSSATVTSASGGHLAPPPPAASAPGTGAPPAQRIRAPEPGTHAPPVWFNQINTGCNRLVSTGPYQLHIS